MTMNGSLRIAAAAAQGPYQLGITDPADEALVDGDTAPLVVRAAVVMDRGMRRRNIPGLDRPGPVM